MATRKLGWRLVLESAADAARFAASVRLLGGVAKRERYSREVRAGGPPNVIWRAIVAAQTPAAVLEGDWDSPAEGDGCRVHVWEFTETPLATWWCALCGERIDDAEMPYGREPCPVCGNPMRVGDERFVCAWCENRIQEEA